MQSRRRRWIYQQEVQKGTGAGRGQFFGFCQIQLRLFWRLVHTTHDQLSDSCHEVWNEFRVFVAPVRSSRDSTDSFNVNFGMVSELGKAMTAQEPHNKTIRRFKQNRK